MKFRFSTLLSSLIVIGLASCGNSASTDKDSVATDTVPAVAADTTAIAPAADTVAAVEVNPEEVLTASIAKKSLRYADESSAKKGTVTVNVTNKGTVEVKGSAYEVAYKELVEETKNGEFVEVTKNRTVPGIDVPAGETVTVTLKAKSGCQDIKSPSIKAVK